MLPGAAASAYNPLMSGLKLNRSKHVPGTAPAAAGGSGPARPAAPAAGTGRRRAPARRLLIPLVILLVPLGLYGGYWLFLAQTAAAQLADWTEAQRQQGIKIDYQGPASHGFPLRVGLRISDIRIEVPGDGGVLTWKAPSLSVETLPWRPTVYEWQAPGPHEIANTRGLQARIKGLEGWTILEGSGSPQISVRMDDLRASANGRQFGAARINGDLIPAQAQDTSASATTDDRFKLDLKDGYFPQGVSPLGPKLERLIIELQPTENLQQALSSGTWPQSMLEWRDRGGVLEVRRLNGVHGPLGLDGDGTLSIDPAGQPEGAFALRVTGFAQTIEALRRARVISNGVATSAQLVTRALASEDTANGAVLKLPLAVQEQTLSIGPLSLLRLPRVRWFDPAR